MMELVESQMTSRILMYKTNHGETRVEVLFNGQTFWLTQKRMADLYTVDVSTVNYHLGQIFTSGELKEEAVIRKIPITAADGKDYDTLIYNLDAIIAVGYRVNSYQATQFRIWAMLGKHGATGATHATSAAFCMRGRLLMMRGPFMKKSRPHRIINPLIFNGG